MPVSKRFLADAQLYAPPDIYEESTEENVLRDISSAGNLGALHQISFLSLYAFEVSGCGNFLCHLWCLNTSSFSSDFHALLVI